jgi:formylglycine-generating enzyme required for sulfatase activity
VAVLALLLSNAVAFAEETHSKGLVVAPPSSGRYVETAQGAMIPYTETIPGTDVTFEMVPIPGGTFQMGSPPDEADRGDDEGPQIEVRVAPFWMGKCEVTWAEFRQFMDQYDLFKELQSRDIRTVKTDNKVDAVTIPTPLYDPSYTFALGDDPRQPAVTMTQYAAKQYTKWLSRLTANFYRLPSEAEWEYACRAGSKGPFPANQKGELVDYAWFYDNSDDEYHPVGTKKPNAWDLHDMHGNVAELVLDQYDPHSYQRFEGRQAEAIGMVIWPTQMFRRVIRGGSWESDPEHLRSAARSATENWRLEDPNVPKSPWWFTDEQALTVGFRLVRPLQPPPPQDQLQYWDSDAEELLEAVANRMAEGRGVTGIVDQKLPADADQLKASAGR